MVSRLNQFPTFSPFGTKEVLQPSNTSLAHIVDKTSPCLIAFDNILLFTPRWKLVKRNLVFPIRHILPLFFPHPSPLERKDERSACPKGLAETHLTPMIKRYTQPVQGLSR